MDGDDDGPDLWELFLLVVAIVLTIAMLIWASHSGDE